MRGACILLFSLVPLAAQAQTPRAPTNNPAPQTAGWPEPREGDFTLREFQFRSGEKLPELRLHYATLGQPARDSGGRVTNAVLILHGTTGSSKQFLQPAFAGVLFSPGGLLDAGRYFIVLPDGIGHGHSSKPSDSLRAHFPRYDYDDMVRAQHDLLVQGLGVNHLRLVLGTSMGCMHSWIWGETYADFMDALMPLACQPVEIAGRNRIWRKTILDSIRTDPSWKNGEYAEQPAGLRAALLLVLLAGNNPTQWQKMLATREAADHFVDDWVQTRLKETDANDLLYAFDASRDYDPSPKLDRIQVPVMFVNSSDDYINPPEMGIAEREIKKVKGGRFVLIPASDQTRGHGTHTIAAVWKDYLAELLSESSGTIQNR